MGSPEEAELAADAVRRLSPAPARGLREVGAALGQWGSDRDPVGHVAGYFWSGLHYPTLDVVEAALRRLESYVPRARAGESGWGPAEAEEVEGLADWLRDYLRERREARGG